LTLLHGLLTVKEVADSTPSSEHTAREPAPDILRPITLLSISIWSLSGRGVAERDTLEGWAHRPKTAQAPQRSRIVLECAGGSPNTAVADKLGVTYQSVGKWRQRFLARRLAGLLDEPRPGSRSCAGSCRISGTGNAALHKDTSTLN